mgnify:CR=1 FL=1
MILKKYEKLPKDMQNNEVKEYYDILRKKKISLIMKRIFDIIVSLLLLIILSPILLIISIAIKIDSKGPVFYRQERITQYGKKFKIFKFRTMVVNADKIGSLITIEGDNRITKIGKKIRKCRIDELPQLINIFKGEMSFVGTRPEVQKYVKLYTNEMKATLLMPAGVTSIASIKYKDEDEVINRYLNGGKKVDDIYVKRVLPEKMKWNLKYIKDFGFWKDLKIMIDTVINVI